MGGKNIVNGSLRKLLPTRQGRELEQVPPDPVTFARPFGAWFRQEEFSSLSQDPKNSISTISGRATHVSRR